MNPQTFETLQQWADGDIVTPTNELLINEPQEVKVYWGQDLAPLYATMTGTGFSNSVRFTRHMKDLGDRWRRWYVLDNVGTTVIEGKKWRWSQSMINNPLLTPVNPASSYVNIDNITLSVKDMHTKINEISEKFKDLQQGVHLPMPSKWEMTFQTDTGSELWDQLSNYTYKDYKGPEPGFITMDEVNKTWDTYAKSDYFTSIYEKYTKEDWLKDFKDIPKD